MSRKVSFNSQAQAATKPEVAITLHEDRKNDFSLSSTAENKDSIKKDFHKPLLFSKVTTAVPSFGVCTLSISPPPFFPLLK